MPKYIVQARKGNNPAIMQLQEDGYYEQIAYGAGEDSLTELLELVKLANLFSIEPLAIKRNLEFLEEQS